MKPVNVAYFTGRGVAPATADIITQILSISPPSLRVYRVQLYEYLCVCVCGYVSVLNYAMCRACRRPYTSFTMRRFHLFFAFALIFSSLHFHGQPAPRPDGPFVPQLCCNPRLLKHSYRTAQHWTAARWSASDGLATSPAHNAC